MDNKILITGATGNIGKEIINLLKVKNANFVALTTKGEAIDGVKTLTADFSDKESLRKVMQGISTLFLLLPSHPMAEQFGENAINVAKEMGVKHIVRSSGCFANPNSDFFIEKLLGNTDKYLKESGINYTITAPSSFMQNLSTTLANDYKTGTMYQSAGDGKVSWVHLKDIAKVNVEVLLNPEKYVNHTLPITGSESLSYEEVVNKMNAILGKQTNYVAIPSEMASQKMSEMQFPQFVIDLLISLNESIKQGHFSKTENTVEKITGNKPISFEQFVEENKNSWL